MSGDANKRLSVERIYQKKTQREHILLRPDTYIGSVQPNLEVKIARLKLREVFLNSFYFRPCGCMKRSLG